MANPCDVWPVPEACSYGIPAVPAARTPLQVHAMAVATEILWRLTAGIYGLCTLTVRPCGCRCTGTGWVPFQQLDGSWINVVCGCESQCGCCYVCELELEGPVASVTSVKIDGVALNPSEYRIDNGNMLVRTGDNIACWPQCQKLGLPDTQVGTFSVTYSKGLAVPVGGQMAVAALAAEIVKACTAGPCQLPARVQEVVRQGERITLINDVDTLRSGLTFIPEVDQWLVAVNPYGLREQPFIMSPDLLPSPRITTWP